MLNLRICRKCSACEKYLSPVRNEKDELIGLPSVCCKIEDMESACLNGDSEIPSQCLYLVEQKITEDEAWNEHEDIIEEVKSVETAK